MFFEPMVSMLYLQDFDKTNQLIFFKPLYSSIAAVFQYRGVNLISLAGITSSAFNVIVSSHFICRVIINTIRYTLSVDSAFEVLPFIFLKYLSFHLACLLKILNVFCNVAMSQRSTSFNLASQRLKNSSI